MSSKIFVPFKLEPELIEKLEQTIAGKDFSLSATAQEQLGPPRPGRPSGNLKEIAEAEIFFGGYIPPEQFAAAKKLKWIQVPFAGVNRLLTVGEIIESEVIVTNAAGIMAPAMADQIMGYVIGFSRRLPEQWQLQQRKEWGRLDRLFELAGQTLGIIGHGRIGIELAKRARAFGMRVIATKTNPAGDYPELDLVLPSRELPRLLAEADYVVMCVPLTPQTQGMLGRAEFEQMKSTAYFINIARGQVVKEAELIEILREKRIGGAALDVFEQEPLPATSPFWEMENVIVTPHSSGNFEGFITRSVELFCKNLERYFEGQPLINLVDKKRGY